MAWEDTSPGVRRIMARFVAGDGSLPGDAFLFDQSGAPPGFSPAALALNDGFLVTAHQHGGLDSNVIIGTVTLAGTPGNRQALSEAAGNQLEVALAGNGQTALALWEGEELGNDYDIFGKQATVALAPGALQTTTITYDYDPLYRLRTAVYTGAITATYEFAYDGVGNRLIFSRTITATEVTTYTYNAANQLVTARLNTSPDTWYYVYDANGNQVRQVPNGVEPAAGEVRYTFDQRNLLVQVENHDGSNYQVQAEIVYDGSGNRLRTVAYLAGVPMTTTYTLDPAGGGRPLAAEAGGTETLFLYGLFGIGEYDTEGRYYLGDAQLSVRQLLDEADGVLLARTYAPFGLLLQQAGTGNALYGYAGSLSGGGGLLYVNGRYFDPSTGRFLGPDSDFDPLQPSRSLNGYIISIILSNPGALLFGPLLILSWHKRRGGKGHYMLWLVMGLALGLTLVACGQKNEETPTQPPSIPPPAPPPATRTPAPPPATSTPAPATQLPPPTQTPVTPTSTPTDCPLTLTPTSTPSPFPPLPDSRQIDLSELRDGPRDNPGGLQAYRALEALQNEKDKRPWWGNEIDALEAMMIFLNHEFGNLRNLGGPNRLPDVVLETTTRKYNQFCIGGPWTSSCFNGFWAYSQVITLAEYSQGHRDNIRNNPRYSYEGFPDELKRMAAEVMTNPSMGGQDSNRPSDWFTLNDYTPVSRQRYWDSIIVNGLGAEPTQEVFWCWPQPKGVPDEPIPLELFVVFTRNQYPGTIRD